MEMSAPLVLMRGISACLVLLNVCVFGSGRSLQQVSFLGNPFPVFHLPPAVIPSLALPTNTGPAALASNSPLKLAHAQPGYDPLTLNTDVPASAANIGLGAQAFPSEPVNSGDLFDTVAANITLFLQQTFGGSCKVPNCAGIENAFWAMLVDNLALASQGNADASMVSKLVSKLNNFLYIVQPYGITSTPPDLIAKIQSLTPLPTPDPQSLVITTIMNHTAEAEGLLQKLTGFKESPGGFSQVLQDYFGNVPTRDGATASASGAAGG